ncbi:MAG: sugar ABC transporter ATP-binding protein [Planctomycetota bacterium]|nr:sugar ABC transporter ATP-binding protein [Planctomycetota bacterium]
MQVHFQHVSRSFPGVQALSDVSFEVASGACHALLGENGAGKSTLGKILAGLYRPESGQIALDGRPVQFHSPREAMRAGVGIVHQELVFCPDLSIAENLCLHDLPSRGWRLDRAKLRDRARTLLARVRLDVDVDARLGTLSLAQEQLVQIAAAVGLGARVLVFDEPTSSLGRAETENLFQLIHALQAEGTTILYVSHRLEEIFALCQTATILRDGRHVATKPIGELDPQGIVRLMVGRNVDAVDLGTPLPSSGPPRIRIRRLSLPGRFTKVDLELRAGEIVGLAGLVGAGRTELGETLAGLHPDYTGELEIDGNPIRIRSPRQALKLGIGLIPEDRKRQGLVLGMSVRENSTLSILDRLRGWLGKLNRSQERKIAESARQRLAIRTPDIDAVWRQGAGCWWWMNRHAASTWGRNGKFMN